MMGKSKKNGEYGKYILENKDVLLRKKRKKRAIKRSIFTLIVMITILITLCFNLDYFNIAEIQVEGNKNVTTDAIIELSQLKSGENIFKFKNSNIRNHILMNPYIMDVVAKRKLPNKISLKVTERKATFYINYNDSFYVIDNNLVVLEKRDSIDNMALIKLEGIDFSTAEIGKVIPFEAEKVKAIISFSNFLYDNNIFDEHVITALQLNEFIDINIYVDNAYIKLGTTANMKDKLIKAFSVLKEEHLKGFKGYVDVSFNGNPVINKQE